MAKTIKVHLVPEETGDLPELPGPGTGTLAAVESRPWKKLRIEAPENASKLVFDIPVDLAEGGYRYIRFELRLSEITLSNAQAEMDEYDGSSVAQFELK